jgi:hypothetical protein
VGCEQVLHREAQRFEHCDLTAIVTIRQLAEFGGDMGGGPAPTMIQSADKRLDLFESGYHELLNDTERARVLEAILAWLRERLPAGPSGTR